MSDSRMMLGGKIITMSGNLLANLNNGLLEANAVVRQCLKAKMQVVDSLAQATTNAGIAQSLGQSVQGIAGIAGGAAGIAGGALGVYGSAGHLADIKGLSTVEEGVVAAGNRGVAAGEHGIEMVGQRVGGGAAPVGGGESALTEFQKDLKMREFAAKWGQHEKFSTLLSQGVPALAQGAGSLGQAPYTALAAVENAESQKAQAVSEAMSSQMSTTEGMAQNLQQFFGQTTNLAAQSLQWAVIMAGRG